MRRDSCFEVIGISVYLLTPGDPDNEIEPRISPWTEVPPLRQLSQPVPRGMSRTPLAPQTLPDRPLHLNRFLAPDRHTYLLPRSQKTR